MDRHGERKSSGDPRVEANGHVRRMLRAGI